MSLAELSEEVKQLKSIRVETNTFNARLSHFLYHTQLTIDELSAKCGENAQNSIKFSQFFDLVRLFKDVIGKKTSKNEFVDNIIKRAKTLAEFKRIEQQLFSLIDSTDAISITNSKLNNSIIQLFVNELDWKNNKDTLQELKCFIDHSRDFDNKEHIAPILTLISYLNNQSLHESCSIRLFETSYLVEPSMRFLNTLNDAVAASVPKDKHGAQSSMFSSFGYSHEVEAEEHHSAIYTGFGESYRAVWNGALVAVKKIRFASVFQGGAIGLREAAACMQSNSRHIRSSPFLSSLLGAAVDPFDQGVVYFLSQLAPLGSLYDNISNPVLADSPLKMKISPADKLSVLMDVVQGLKHLHSQGFVHGRLKDSNVLLFDGYRAKLGDFGVQTFFSNASRLNLKGTRGMRWTPPEVVQLEVSLVERPAAASSAAQQPIPSQRNRGKTLAEASSLFPYALTPSIDCYAVGLVAMVLLSERMPFSNVPFEEGVRGQLLEGIPPTMSRSYADYSALCSLEPLMYECLGPPEHRPAMSELVPVLEHLYCELEHAQQQQLLAQRNAEIEAVQKETREIGKKIKEHVQLISKGREMISRKDADKILLHNPKERRERELELDRARIKLRGFEEELSGLQEDLAGAEHDVGELFQLRKAVQSRLDFDKRHALEIRSWSHSFDQTELLARYCTERDRGKVQSFLTSEESLEELVIEGDALHFEALNGGTACPQSTGGVEEAKNPFLNLRDQSVEVTSERRAEIERDIRNGEFAHQHLVEALDTIFRVPLNPNLLETQLKDIQAQKTGLQHGSTSDKLHSGFVDEEELYEVDNVLLVSHNNGTAGMKSVPAAPQRQEVASVDTAAAAPAVPTLDPSTTSVGYSNSPFHSASNQLYTEKQATAPAGTVFKTTFTAVESTELDSDDEDVDGEAYGAHSYNNTYNNTYDQYATNESSQYEESYNPMTGGGEGEEWLEEDGILVTDEDFPAEECDILHCQYLSAARGSWEEAVGMRRNGLGFTDAEIKKYLEDGHTAAHIAASLGHLSIFKALTEIGGVEFNSVNHLGETPMHCACARGHLSIVQYLTEVYEVSADAPNASQVTPVQMAASGGFVHLLRYFLELSPLKVSPMTRDAVHGASLLHWACLNSRHCAVEYLLLTFHLPVETKALSDESTCLLWASFGASLKVVQYLVEQANADPKAKSKSGMSCLHMATLSGSVEKTVYLMETVRLSIAEKDGNHKSPFDLATGKCAMFLKERKAKGFVVGSVVEKTRKVKKRHLT